MLWLMGPGLYLSLRGSIVSSFFLRRNAILWMAGAPQRVYGNYALSRSTHEIHLFLKEPCILLVSAFLFLHLAKMRPNTWDFWSL